MMILGVKRFGFGEAREPTAVTTRFPPNQSIPSANSFEVTGLHFLVHPELSPFGLSNPSRPFRVCCIAFVPCLSFVLFESYSSHLTESKLKKPQSYHWFRQKKTQSPPLMSRISATMRLLTCGLPESKSSQCRTIAVSL